MRALTFRAAATLSAAAFALAPVATATASAPASERIGYTLAEAEHNFTLSVKPDGSDRRTLVRSVADTVDVDPDFGPAGQVAFVRVSSALDRYELRVTVPGKSPRLVYATKKRLAAPDWAPDGKRLALTVDDETGARLHTIGLDGKGLKRVLPAAKADGPSTAENDPTWSPDGKRIAYSLRTETYPTASAQLRVVNTAGKPTVRVLTTGNAIDQQPAWSPDGNRVLFVRQQDNADAHSKWSLLAVDATTPGVGAQPSPDAIVPGGEAEILGASWAPDAKRVAYSLRSWAENARGELHVTRADGANDRVIRREGVGATIVAVTWGKTV